MFVSQYVLFVCLDLLINTQVWKQVCLLDLAQLADQGGLGCYGAIGGPDFFPNNDDDSGDDDGGSGYYILMGRWVMAGYSFI